MMHLHIAYYSLSGQLTTKTERLQGNLMVPIFKMT